MDHARNREPINILQWNARSVENKGDQLRSVMYNYQVLCLQETWWSADDDTALDKCNFKYATFDRPRGQNGGGVAVVVRKDIQFERIDIREHPGLEIVGVRLLNLEKKISVFSVYRVPDWRVSQETRTDLFEFFDALEGGTILCGDFNAHHTMWSTYCNSEGNALAEGVSSSSFVVLNDHACSTLIPRPGERLGSPDVRLATKEIETQIEWRVLDNNLSSDHLPIEIKLFAGPTTSYTERHCLNTRRVDWEGFELELKRRTENKNYEDMESVKFYDIITEDIKKALLTSGAKEKCGS